MARSVNYLSGAVAVAYIPTDEFIGEELDQCNGYLWDWAVEGVVSRLQDSWPSFEEADEWDNRETRIIAENGHAIVGVSEYCGITSISIAVHGQANNPEFSEAWISKIAQKFCDTFGSIVKIGTFSNGQSVYERKVS
jgi:hypothetical protein